MTEEQHPKNSSRAGKLLFLVLLPMVIGGLAAVGLGFANLPNAWAEAMAIGGVMKVVAAGLIVISYPLLGAGGVVLLGFFGVIIVGLFTRQGDVDEHRETEGRNRR